MAEETEQTEGAEPEMVPLYESDDADIEAFLTNALKLGEDAEPEEKEEAALEEDKEEPEEAPKKRGRPPKEQVEEAKTSTDDLVSVSQAEWQKLQDRVKQQEQFIQRRNTELGNLRTQNQGLIEQLQQALDQAETHSEARLIQKKIDQAEEQITQIDQEEQRNNHLAEAQRVVATFLKPHEMDVEAMATCLERDGIPAQAVGNFKANPLMFMSSDAIVQLGKRSFAENLLRRVVPYVKNLEGQVADLKKQATTRGDEVLEKINTLSKAKPQITASTGKSSQVLGKGASLSDEQLAEMSDEELQKLLQNTG